MPVGLGERLQQTEGKTRSTLSNTIKKQANLDIHDAACQVHVHAIAQQAGMWKHVWAKILVGQNAVFVQRKSHR
eukprot:3208000-Pyramimonas_sp.AAC.1